LSAKITGECCIAVVRKKKTRLTSGIFRKGKYKGTKKEENEEKKRKNRKGENTKYKVQGKYES